MHPDDWALWTAAPSLAPRQWRSAVAEALGLALAPDTPDDTRPVAELLAELTDTLLPRAREAARLLSRLPSHDADLVRPALARRLGVPAEPLAVLEAEIREHGPPEIRQIDPVVGAVVALLDHTQHRRWSGSIADLARYLAVTCRLDQPPTPEALRALTPRLAASGIHVDWALDRVTLRIADGGS